jgi:hypothetical protein
MRNSSTERKNKKEKARNGNREKTLAEFAVFPFSYNKRARVRVQLRSAPISLKA